MLARAVHRDRRLVESGSDERRPGRRRRAGSQAASAARSRRARPTREDPAYAVDVERLARVAGAPPGPAVRRRGRARSAACPAPGSACCTSAGRSALVTSPIDQSTVTVGRRARPPSRGDGPRRTRSGRSRRGSPDQPRGDERTHPRSGARLGRRRSGTIARVSALTIPACRSRSGRPRPASSTTSTCSSTVASRPTLDGLRRARRRAPAPLTLTVPTHDRRGRVRGRTRST